jgi:hypothetical protein
VLFGWEKGWFIYTPIAIFMVIGLFMMRGKSFRRAVLTFCLLNIWIIIAWSDWRYGASYSTRALTQSYPVFALALAAFLERVGIGWKQWVVAIAGVYLIGVNLFQIWQYNATILHYDHMNRQYYAAIYLDRNPTPEDYSLLDTEEWLADDSGWRKAENYSGSGTSPLIDLTHPYALVTFPVKGERWIKSELRAIAEKGVLTGQFVFICTSKGKVIKEKRFRMAVPFAKDGKEMIYRNHLFLPEEADTVYIRLDSFGEMKLKRYDLSSVLYKRK